MTKKFVVLILCLALSSIAWADWFPGDGHKMHYPQLPDEEGWNVHASWQEIADDWQCSQTGPVTEIHFWGSWLTGNAGTINDFTINIYADIPDPEPGNPNTHSMPGELLWSRVVPLANVMTRHIVPTPPLWEGWYDPITGQTIYPDHDNYYQYNIFGIENPFIQEQDSIYWLGITADIAEDPQFITWGWKSSIDHWNDDAVFRYEVDDCVAPDNGAGTVDLPAPCDYVEVDEPFMIIDGLPPGTTIECHQTLNSLISQSSTPGGSLGGEVILFTGDLVLDMVGTGDLTGYVRHITIPVACEMHIGPRNPGDPIQAFPTEFYKMQGSIVGDPDFDYLQIVAGTFFGLPSPGQITLTDLGDGTFAVENFFDITYTIDFVGSPGAIIDGMSGSTTGTARIKVDENVADAWNEMYEPDIAETITNGYYITLDPAGAFLVGGGDDFFGSGWYYYPIEEWWNIWFYDHPFSYDRYKTIHIEFDCYPFTGASDTSIEVAINWSTDQWSLDHPMDSLPPLPGENEELYIGRDTVLQTANVSGHYAFDFTLPDYNPEWVSIDVRGNNFVIENGIIEHTCILKPGMEQSMDMSFVINNDTCANQNPGDVNNDGIYNIQDLVYLINFLFKAGPAPPIMANADLNGDCCIDFNDILYFIDFYLQGGPDPVECTCLNPPICIPAPPPHIDGEVFHNIDGYVPPDGDPSGTDWLELYSNYPLGWQATSWNDDGDGILGVGDEVRFVDQSEPTTSESHAVLNVTTTIELNEWGTGALHYIELIDPPNPLNDTIYDPLGTFWMEVYPDYGRKYVLVFMDAFMTPTPLQPGNEMLLQVLNQPDSGSNWTGDITSLGTDIVTEEIAGCDCIPGECDNRAGLNILDITYLISYLYYEGPPPVPFEACSGDPTCNCTVNILDITHLIAFFYKEGPPPCTCEDWLDACGPPLRK